MRPRTVIALVGVAFALAVLSVTGRTLGAPRGMTDAQRRAVVAEVEAQLREAYDLSREDVTERLLSLYPDSGRVVSATGGQVITSRDSLAEGIRYFWENVGRNMREPRWIWESMIVDPLSPTAAVMTATYRVPHLTPQGHPHEIGGAWTAVLVKEGARWVILHEHLSDSPAPESGGIAQPAPTAPTVDTTLLRGP